MNIPLELEREIAAKVEARSYTSPEALLRDALDALDAQDDVEQKLLGALSSGDMIEVTPGFWDDRKRKLLASLERNRPS
ncbi:MAG: hypothetical protein AAB353_09610 [Candidatus Hydrogenedentota bacterium]